jgi:Family of unknown function (DUF6297)
MTSQGIPESVPGARPLRRRMRRLRRPHHAGSIGEVLTDVYMIVLVLALYGWGTASGIRGFLASPAVQETDANGRYWIAVAAALAAAGLAWQGMRVVGPLLVTPAAQTWVFSSPVDRRGLLVPRFGVLALGAAAGVGVLGLAAGFAGGTDPGAELAWYAVAGVTSGATGAALGILAQASGRDPRWARRLGVGLVAGGIAITLGVIATRACAASLDLCGGLAPRPLIPPTVLTAALALVTLPVAVVAMVLAGRALGRVDRASLTAGAEVASTATSAALMLDASMLTRLLEARRWRSVGLVRGRPLPGRPGRIRWGPEVQRLRVLVLADLRRRLRDPFALRAWGALLLVMYAIAVALPAIEGSAHVILGYLAANRLTAGLRTVSRSDGLRRLLGGTNLELRLAHLVVPAVGAAIWYLVTLPVIRPLSPVDAILVPGIILAAYRTATQPAIRYGGASVDTPFGMISVDLIRQLFRGWDLVAILVLVELLVR